MRMLKSGLKLVLDTYWTIDEESGELFDITIDHDTYGARKYYEGAQDDPYDPNGDGYLGNLDVKLPLDHRYIITVYFPNNEVAATVRFDTFGLEEEIKWDKYTEGAGYTVLFLWLYNIDNDGVSGSDFPVYMTDAGITFNPVTIYGSYQLKVYQLD